jgi:hypothetical protein
MNKWRGKGFGSSTPSSLSRPQLPGAPYLARFSRDVGYRRASPLALSPQATVQGKTRGIPHLAKNERDMGHPAIVVGTEKTAKRFAPFIPSLTCRQASQPLGMTKVRGSELLGRSRAIQDSPGLTSWGNLSRAAGCWALRAVSTLVPGDRFARSRPEFRRPGYGR